MKGEGNAELERRREKGVMIRKTGVWIGGCVTPYLVVPAAEQPSLKQTKKQNTKTRHPQMGFPVRTCCTQETSRTSRAFGFISGISPGPHFITLRRGSQVPLSTAWGMGESPMYKAHWNRNLPSSPSPGTPHDLWEGRRTKRVGDSQAQSSILPIVPTHWPPWAASWPSRI